jgi:hypothetical protein
MTTNDSSRMVRWLVIIVLGAATAGMIAVSLRANYLFGYGFGQTPEKAQVFGWANVAADLWKVAGLIVITSLWRAGQGRYALSLMPIWLLCLVWGLASAVGVYAQDRTALIGGREAVAATYKDAETELEDIDAKLRGLKTQRSVAQVGAAIAAVLARPVMSGERVRGTVRKLSANCTREYRLTAVACLEIADLREERAAAEERSRLETRKATLLTHITKLRERGGSLPADPVAELFAWLSGGQLKVRDIAFGFPLVFAFLIEIVSAFGPAGIVAYARDARTQTSLLRHSRTWRALASSCRLWLASARTAGSSNGWPFVPSRPMTRRQPRSKTFMPTIRCGASAGERRLNRLRLSRMSSIACVKSRNSRTRSGNSAPGTTASAW